MPPLREEAETLRLALLMGCFKPDEVVAWADRRIAELAAPPIELVDVATAGGQPPDELARLLKPMPGPADLAAAAHRALGVLRARAISDGFDLKSLTHKLYVYSLEANVSEDEQMEAMNFDDQYDCLVYYGTPEHLRNEVDRYIAEHAAEAGDLV
ncbi:hypothetical protein [Paludisphaera rhizosphaerae]|uniref:hypothetical protein n=1 Tax=Paludisphaera rhizosphaerae TaxID=2711216 RepID=UPI0013EB2B19|nr:hypothetical protein [Paludisphaera rhizosphaerae]